ncbi:hypothetical protein D3C76_1791730 [compost metagenome]
MHEQRREQHEVAQALGRWPETLTQKSLDPQPAAQRNQQGDGDDGGKDQVQHQAISLSVSAPLWESTSG